MVLLLFFCSGVTGLVYEVIWSKHLALLFGSTIWAQTIVLASFMGGLALGYRLIGARADLLRHPLATYGYLEIAIAVYAFLFPVLYGMADATFCFFGERWLHHGLLLLALKGVLAAALLLPPTILMGGTLPLLAAWLRSSSTDAGRGSARFYAINSFGAVLGSFLAGFCLVQWLGLASTMQMTALANAAIGAAAVLLCRRRSQLEPRESAAIPEAGSTSEASQRLLRQGCWVVALTGAVSMGMEVLASRGLILIFGASLQAFSIVLIAFILGIGIGSSVVASRGWAGKRNEIAIVAALLGAAAWICLFIWYFEPLVETYRYLRAGFTRTAIGYRYHQVMAALVSLIVLGVPAALLGAVLPLWIRAVGSHTTHIGQQVGRLLTWNTVGAVAGVLLTGFVLMPVAGLRGACGIMAAILSGAALLFLVSRRIPGAAALALAVLVFAVFVGFRTDDSWQYILSSGVFRVRDTEANEAPLSERRHLAQIRFYEDAADATVSVEQHRNRTNALFLKINGKTDASTAEDMSTQYMLAHLPMAARPDAADVFVLGFGSGVTAGALLGHPEVQRIVVAENCEPVLAAEQFFRPWNRGVLTNARTRVINEDARTILKLDPQPYDVVICEPSNPWTVGVGSVFSREFYELAASRLKTNGVICQWFHVYEMHDGIVSLVLRTFGTVFPAMEIWETDYGDILLLGARQPFHLTPENVLRILNHPEPRKDLQAIGLSTPEAFFSRQLASMRTAYAIAGEGPIQTDGFPVLEYEAPKAFFLGRYADSLFAFDERTWQHELASAEKQQLLRRIPEAVLDEAFAKHGSANPQLRKYLVHRSSAGINTPLRIGLDSFPTIFAPAAPPPALSPTNATDVIAFLVEGVITIETADAAAGARQVVSALSSTNWDTSNRSVATHFAARAVKSCLARQNLVDAVSILKAALKVNPESDALKFLARILERRHLEATSATHDRSSDIPPGKRQPSTERRS